MALTSSLRLSSASTVRRFLAAKSPTLMLQPAPMEVQARKRYPSKHPCLFFVPILLPFLCLLATAFKLARAYDQAAEAYAKSADAQASLGR